MIEHPDFTGEFARSHYDMLLQEAEIERRARAFDEANENRSGFMNAVNNMVAELKLWAKNTGSATTRA